MSSYLYNDLIKAKVICKTPSFWIIDYMERIQTSLQINYEETMYNAYHERNRNE